MARNHSRCTLIGQRFGRLVVLAETANRHPNGSIYWLCRCDCNGTRCIVVTSNLRRGSTKSCGCLKKEFEKRLGTRPITHGMSGTSTYRSWCAMMRRCYDHGYKDYPYYGGRGITVCERWHRFENFYADMGERPEGMTLDRVDVNRQYNKSNCRWASRTTQMNNTTRNRWLTYEGTTMTMSEWAKVTGISYTVLRARLNMLHWSLGRALEFE
jgi:hypothetical protein